MTHPKKDTIPRKYITQSAEELTQNDVTELQEIIRTHRQLYNQETPVISDKEYDQLYTLLVRLEEIHNINDPQSPTQSVDHLVESQFSKGDHKYLMGSLDNTYDAQDLYDFEKRIGNILKKDDSITLEQREHLGYAIELKFDGLGVALTYENGKLTRGLTRGNGTTGENISINLMQIASIPKKIQTNIPSLEIRGEIIMPIASFEKLNAQRATAEEKIFANPRNAASGSVRQKDWTVTAERQLDFYAYSCPDIEPTTPAYTDIISQFQKWGFLTTPLLKTSHGIKGVVDIIERMNGKPSYPFEIDGLVIKLNDVSLWSKLGSTAHHPRSAISYKFPASYERTKILQIIHSVGRTGTITPVADVEAVNIGGAVVRRATLHNYDEAVKKGVKIGDHVWIHRAGEVIPEIIGPIIESRDGSEKEISIPTHCPICSSEAKQDGEKVALICTNPTCPAKISGQLEWFVSKHGLDIDGFGPAQIDLFLKKEWITTMADIFLLHQYESELLAQEGYKERAVSNLLSAIESARNQPAWRVISALGVSGVGKRTAKTLEHLFTSKESFTEFNVSMEDLESIVDIGPETAKNIISYFQLHKATIQKLVDHLNIDFPANNPKNASSVLQGKSFCVTGSFDGYSRDQIHDIIEKHGGETRTSVSKKLDYLIAGEKAGSKISKATEASVTILTIDDFLNLLKTKK